jgi:hypothetical protein
MDCISIRPQKRPADMEAIITRLELARHTLIKPQISPDLGVDDSNCPLDDSHVGL